MTTEETDERSAGQRIAETLTIVGGIGVIYKCLIGVLIWRNLAMRLVDPVQNRTVIMRIVLFMFHNWPFGVFALGIYLLARIRFGPPGTWMAQTQPKRAKTEQPLETVTREGTGSGGSAYAEAPARQGDGVVE